MTQRFPHIGLFIRQDDPKLDDGLRRLVDFLQSQNCQISVNTDLSCLPDLNIIEIADYPQHCDLAIAAGGDGTLLAAARALAGSNLPLLGINFGHLGFLADVPLNELEIGLAAVFAGQYREDTRFLLQTQFANGETAMAMNDVVIHSYDTFHMVEFEVSINGRFLNSQRADGLVIATPTGSTAYALSAGGPILDVDLNALVLVSICPHALSNRPLVVAAKNTIEITLSEQNRGNAMVTCDGRKGTLLKPGESFTIQQHPDSVRLIHPQQHDHYSILRAKLEWGRKLT
jgi:NAD+ kinase